MWIFDIKILKKCVHDNICTSDGLATFCNYVLKVISTLSMHLYICLMFFPSFCQWCCWEDVVSRILRAFCGWPSFPETLNNPWQCGRSQLGGCSFHENFTGGQQRNIEVIRSVTDAWAAKSGGVECRSFDQLNPELSHEPQCSDMCCPAPCLYSLFKGLLKDRSPPFVPVLAPLFFSCSTLRTHYMTILKGSIVDHNMVHKKL